MSKQPQTFVVQIKPETECAYCRGTVLAKKIEDQDCLYIRMYLREFVFCTRACAGKWLTRDLTQDSGGLLPTPSHEDGFTNKVIDVHPQPVQPPIDPHELKIVRDKARLYDQALNFLARITNLLSSIKDQGCSNFEDEIATRIQWLINRDADLRSIQRISNNAG